MKAHEVLQRAAQLSETGRPYVMASVMNGTPDGAVRTGVKVLVEADGSFYGSFGEEWVADVVRREAENTLRDGQARVVMITRHDGSDGSTDVVVDPAPQERGRGVEVYLDPELPAPTLVLFGDAPVSRALAAMGSAAGYRVLSVGLEQASQYPDVEVVEELDAEDAEESPALFAVVGTSGDWDADAARQALEAGADYVGLVATASQAEEVREALEEAGVDFEDRLVHPAGLELGAKAPEETAVSILAELVRRRRGAAEEPEQLAPEPAAPEPEASETEPEEEEAAAEEAPEPSPEPSGQAAVEKLAEAEEDEPDEPEPRADEPAGADVEEEPAAEATEAAEAAEAEPDEPEAPEPEAEAEPEAPEPEAPEAEAPEAEAPEVPDAEPSEDEDEEPEIDFEAVEQGMMDPVCGLDLSEAETYMLTYQGTTYHFCCNACRKKFEEVPHEFIPGAEEED